MQQKPWTMVTWNADTEYSAVLLRVLFFLKWCSFIISEFTGQRGGRITATADIVNNHFILMILLWLSARSVQTEHPAGSLSFSFKGTFMKIKQHLRNHAACKNLYGFYCVSPHFFHWSGRCHVFYFKLSFWFLAQGEAASSKHVIYTSEFVHISKKHTKKSKMTHNLFWVWVYTPCFCWYGAAGGGGGLNLHQSEEAPWKSAQSSNHFKSLWFHTKRSKKKL